MSAQTPQRYDCAGPKHPWEHCEGCYHMEPHPRGDYVQWDDYDSLLALNAELLAAVEEAASECAECGGTGMHTVHIDGSDTHAACDADEQACPDCADLRALIARAKGE